MSPEPRSTPSPDPTSPAPHGLETERLSLADAFALDPGGVLHDVEVDEVFLVLAGAGSVTFADGSVLALHPGVLVQLRAGERTVWEITETLRKLYVALPG